MNTRLADEFGIEFPIFAFSHCRDVVAAVSRAGGMGVLGALAFSTEQLEIELKWIDEHCDGKPYGVDIVMPATIAGGDLSSLRNMIPPQHQQFVDDLMKKYEVPELPDGEGSWDGLLGWVHDTARSQVDVALQHPIKLIANALGTPPRDVLDKVHDAGIKVAALVGTAAQAKTQVEAGTDIIVAQGTEAGGHTGEVATMVLVPEVVDAVAPLPVLAAGGIGNGRQLTAALALGAQGVWMGSIWLTTEEAETHPVVKQKFLRATSRDTVRSRSLTGKPARMLRTAWTEAWDDPASPDPLPMPLQPRLVREAQARIARSAHKSPGAAELADYFVGQIVGSMNHVKSVRTVIEELVQEYADTMERLDDLAGESR
jgi:NAD(P)H-dependent flavin oxidoreductase YrpB (nitropropane dioxygenase family)